MSSFSKKKPENSTELTKVNIGTSETTATTTCNPEVCRNARNLYQPPDLATDSPWNTKKAYFFAGTLGIFLLWIIVYTIVSEKKLV